MKKFFYVLTICLMVVCTTSGCGNKEAIEPGENTSISVSLETSVSSVSTTTSDVTANHEEEPVEVSGGHWVPYVAIEDFSDVPVTYEYDDEYRVVSVWSDSEVTFNIYNQDGYLSKSETYLTNLNNEKSEFPIYVSEYDDRGNEISCAEYSEGKLVSTQYSAYEYDDKGNSVKCISTVEYSDSAEVISQSVSMMSYDSQGNILSIESTFTDDVSILVTYSYVNCNGRALISERVVDTLSDEMNYTSVYRFEYDENGNLIRKIQSLKYYFDSEVYAEYSYVYDFEGYVFPDVAVIGQEYTRNVYIHSSEDETDIWTCEEKYKYIVD